MGISFNEESRIYSKRKSSWLDRLADRFVSLGIVKTRQGGFRIISFMALIVLIVSTVSLMLYLENNAQKVPGVDFTPPSDPVF